MTTIEIEDSKGNTLCSFIIQTHIKIKDLKGFDDCNLADEDLDYINKEVNLLRIQLE
jgi:hypothetical protein